MLSCRVQEGLASGYQSDGRADPDRNFALQIGQVNETVEVSAVATGLQTETSTVRTVVTNQLIEDLPLNGRNALSLQTLIPGAVNQAGARVSLSQEDGVSVNGARGNDNNVLLDGGHNNDVYNGTPTSMPNPDALQEFSVLSSSFSAEYGRGAGSLVTAVTKSGTNRFHGSLYEYLRNDVLDARSFFGHAEPGYQADSEAKSIRCQPRRTNHQRQNIPVFLLGIAKGEQCDDEYRTGSPNRGRARGRLLTEQDEANRSR